MVRASIRYGTGKDVYSIGKNVEIAVQNTVSKLLLTDTSEAAKLVQGETVAWSISVTDGEK